MNVKIYINEEDKEVIIKPKMGVGVIFTETTIITCGVLYISDYIKSNNCQLIDERDFDD